MSRLKSTVKSKGFGLTMAWAVAIGIFVAVVSPKTAEIIVFRLEETIRFVRSALAYTF